MLNQQQFGTAGALALEASAAAVAAALLKALRPMAPAVTDAAGCGAAPASLALSSPGGACLALARREFAVLRGARPQTLTCEAGEVWVTLESDSTDYILRPGMRLGVPPLASAIVTAAVTSVVRVATSPCHRTASRRRWRPMLQAWWRARRRALIGLI